MKKVTQVRNFSEGFYGNLNSNSLGILTAVGHFICLHQTTRSTAAERMFQERGKGQISKACSFLYQIGLAARQDKEHIFFNTLFY